VKQNIILIVTSQAVCFLNITLRVMYHMWPKLINVTIFYITRAKRFY